jgi:3-hydroxy-9,10-secoandrosta-1,3,5(10)-triene-9,17-dione monooxygenase
MSLQSTVLDKSTCGTRPTTVDTLLDDLRNLLPGIAADAGEAERQRKAIDHHMQAIADTGIYRFFVPRRYGGAEYPLTRFIDVGLMLGEACTSTAWVTTFCMEHNWMLAQFPIETQDELFSVSPWIIAPGVITPNGRAQAHQEAHQDGYRLTGRWQWGTGVMHADWALLSGFVEETRDVRLFAVPIEQVEIIDTWHPDGMAATGSNDMQVKDAFVPTRFSQSVSAMTIGRGVGALVHQTPMFRMPMMPILYIAAGAPALGAARGMLKRFIERAPSRTKFGSRAAQSESILTHVRAGEATATLEAAEMIMRGVARETMQWGERDDVCPLAERVRHRLLMAEAVRLVRDVVRELFEASGANAHHISEPMQRIHRDVHTIAAHTVFDMEIIAEQAGRIALGMDPTIPL